MSDENEPEETTIPDDRDDGERGDREKQFHGPQVSNTWLSRHVREVRDTDARLAGERDSAATRDLMSTIQAITQREVDSWRALPCRGEVEHVTNCSDACAATCERREHPACPRITVVELRRKEQRRLDKEYDHLTGDLSVPAHILRMFYAGTLRETEAFKRLRGVWPDFDQARPSPAPVSGRRLPTTAPVIVVLSGGIGTGKSCAAGLWATRRNARFITADDFARLSPYDGGWADLANWPAVVLDDLGREYLDPRGFFQASLDSFIDRRYARELDLLITTNLAAKRRYPEKAPSAEDPPQFSERYGARVLDRIREVGRFLTVAGPSLRAKRAA
jgi:hypothetical protein